MTFASGEATKAITSRGKSSSQPIKGASPNRGRTGLRVLVMYKIVHGAFFVAFGITLAIAAVTGGDAWVREFATALHEHVMRAWSVHLADWILRTSSPHSLRLGALALTCDGLFAFFEGWALHRGFRWAPWLVVVATASLLPVEVFELARRVRAGKIVVLIVNLAVLLYLLQRKWSDRYTESSAAHPS